MSSTARLTSYSDYQHSGVEWMGEIPVHWQVCKVKNLKGSGDKSFVDGDWVELPYITASGIRLIQTGNVGVGEYVEKGYRYISNETFQLLNCTEFRPGDILICRLGEPVARACLAPDLGNRMITSVDVCILKASEGVNSKFIVHAMSSQPYLRWVGSLVRGSTRDRVSRSMLGGFYMPVPPLNEQTAIARYLDHADSRIQRYISAKKRLIELLEEERRVATIRAIQSSNAISLRFETVADLVERPITRVSDKTYTPIGLYNRGRGIFLKDPTEGSELGDSDFFWVEEGDLVISGQFAWEGAIALVSDIEHGCIASHRFPTLRGKPGKLDTQFLLSFLQTAWGQVILDHNSRGAAGRNRPLNVRSLMKEKIMLPPIETQRRIAVMLQRELHARKQAKLMEQLLSEYRERLIADVVTGKLDVREAALDEADVPSP